MNQTEIRKFVAQAKAERRRAVETADAEYAGKLQALEITARMAGIKGLDPALFIARPEGSGDEGVALRGELSESVRIAVDAASGPFTVHDIVKAVTPSVGMAPLPSRVSTVLKR